MPTSADIYWQFIEDARLCGERVSTHIILPWSVVGPSLEGDFI